jgi:hypothetical protein
MAPYTAFSASFSKLAATDGGKSAVTDLVRGLKDRNSSVLIAWLVPKS